MKSDAHKSRAAAGIETATTDAMRNVNALKPRMHGCKASEAPNVAKKNAAKKKRITSNRRERWGRMSKTKAKRSTKVTKELRISDIQKAFKVFNALGYQCHLQIVPEELFAQAVKQAKKARKVADLTRKQAS